MKEGTWTESKPPRKTPLSQDRGVAGSSGAVRRPHSDSSTPPAEKQPPKKPRSTSMQTKTYKEAATGFKMAATHRRHPEVTLDQTQADQIEEKLLDAVDVIPGGEAPPDYMGLETAVRQFQDAIVSAYNDNCPITATGNTRKIPWWNRDLAEKRRRVCKLFNAAKKSGNWTDYKQSLTDYNKALQQHKRESCRRHCEEIEKAPECARLHRVLSKESRTAISSIQPDNGDYTTSEGDSR
jgi:hypothetical protein